MEKMEKTYYLYVTHHPYIKQTDPLVCSDDSLTYIKELAKKFNRCEHYIMDSTDKELYHSWKHYNN